MDLEDDLGLGDCGVDVVPDLVYDNRNGRLRNPGYSLWENRIDTVKDIPAVSEFVLDKVVTADLGLYSIMPLFNPRMSSKPDPLRPFNFSNSAASMGSHCSGSAAVVGSVAEDFSKFSKELSRSSVVLISVMGFYELL